MHSLNVSSHACPMSCNCDRNHHRSIPDLLGSVGGPHGCLMGAPHNTMAATMDESFDPSIEVSVAGLDGETLKVGGLQGHQVASKEFVCTTCNKHWADFMTP